MNGFWSRLGAAVAWLGGTASSQAVTPETGHGLIGSNLAEVQKSTDLFTFFMFDPVGEPVVSNGLKITSFKPNGPAFHDLVTLQITTDAQDTIRELKLDVLRSFIESRGNGIYATDLVKSFLYDVATPPGDPISALAGDISTRGTASSGATIITAQPLPKPTGPPSPGYQVYAGDSRTVTLVSGSRARQVVLRNVTQNGAETLEITVSAKK